MLFYKSAVRVAILRKLPIPYFPGCKGLFTELCGSSVYNIFMIQDTHRVCKNCQIEKPIHEFSTYGTKYIFTKKVCKKCKPPKDNYESPVAYKITFKDDTWYVGSTKNSWYHRRAAHIRESSPCGEKIKSVGQRHIELFYFDTLREARIHEEKLMSLDDESCLNKSRAVANAGAMIDMKQKHKSILLNAFKNRSE